MSLSGFVDDVKEREKTLTVFADGDATVAELREFFEVQNIAVRRGHVEGEAPGDFVVLHQEGEAVAVSTLRNLRGSLFLADPQSGFEPGSFGTDEGPDVLNSLGNTTFSVDCEGRTLLTGISNYIGELAFRAGAGTLHSGIRRLSALAEDPSRTTLYRRVADAGVETHVYGDRDADLPDLPGVSVHTPGTEEVARTRFDVFDGAGDDAGKAAMVAIEEDRDSFRGFWTFEAGIVDRIDDYVRETYLG